MSEKPLPDNMPDAYLEAILDYSSAFYAAAMKHGMPAVDCAEAVKHIEKAARELHRLASRSVEIALERDAQADRIAALEAERDNARAQTVAVTETALCCMMVSNPSDLVRPPGWQKRVNDHMRAQRDRITALEAERDKLRKGCECAINEIRDYMTETGGTLPLELAMGWLSAALEAKP